MELPSQEVQTVFFSVKVFRNLADRPAQTRGEKERSSGPATALKIRVALSRVEQTRVRLVTHGRVSPRKRDGEMTRTAAYSGGKTGVVSKS